MSAAAIYFIVGLTIMLAAWIPLAVRNSPLSLPMLAAAVGLFLPLAGGGVPFLRYAPVVEHVTEIVLLSAIYGAGLNIDRRFSLKSWSTTWRLLLVAMPVAIALTLPLALWLLALPFGLAFVLAAILAPTDPVLAAVVQLGPPGEGEEGEVRFGLTTESGLNDGLAFPFVILGVLVQQGSMADLSDLLGWLGEELVASTAIGAAVGIGFGFLIVSIESRLPQRLRLSASHNGLVGLGAAFVTYGLCHWLGGNGFVGVFCHAVALRNFSRSHTYSRQLSRATEQIERIVMVFVMLFFGLALSHGLLAGAGAPQVLFAIAMLLVVRPVSTLAGFAGAALDRRVLFGLGYFGIRGIGSIYYAAYLVVHYPASISPDVLAAVAVTVAASIILYGTTGSFVAARVVDPH